MARHALLLVVVSVPLAACGLYEQGIVDGTTDGGVDMDVTMTDAGADSVITDGKPQPDVNGGDAQVCSGDAAACIAANVPSGWSLVAFAESQATPCPSNFPGAVVVDKPMAPNNACACGACNVTTPPSCTNGTLTYANGNPSCNGTPATLNVTSGMCINAAVDLSGGHFRATALPPTAGVCTSGGTPNKPAVTTTAGVVCVAPSECAAEICDGTPPGGLMACIMTTDDVACPVGTFGTKYLVGDDTTLACTDCSCSVTATSCTAAKIGFFQNVNCANQLGGTVNVDAVCNVTTGGSMAASFRYAATMNGQACMVTGTSTPTVDLTVKRTICCR